MMTLVLILVGVAVGVIGTVLGIGGGIIIVPVLVIGLKVPIHEAIASSLIVITANSLSASALHVKSGMANVNMGLLLGTTAVGGAMIGSAIAISLPQYKVMIVLGCIQLFIAYLTFMNTMPRNAAKMKQGGIPSVYSGCYLDKATGKTVIYNPVRVGQRVVRRIFRHIFRAFWSWRRCYACALYECGFFCSN